MKAILGIDISKVSFDVALLVDSKVFCKKFENSLSGFAKLYEWLNKKGTATIHACLEATGVYGDRLAAFLYSENNIVSIVNPAKIKGFAQSTLSRNKTDKADAKLIAHFCQVMSPPSWHPESQEIQDLQALVKRIDVLIEMRQQEVNRLDVAPSILLPNIQLIIKFMDDQIKEIKSQIQQHIDNNPDLKSKKDLLETIPGLGDATIPKVIAFIDVNKFASAKQLASFIGLNPKQRQSGTSVRGRTMLSKTGSAGLRKAFYMPALVAKRYNPVIKQFCERLKLAGKHVMAILGAAMRKLVHIIYGILKSKQPFSADLHGA
jgi:transposase